MKPMPAAIPFYTEKDYELYKGMLSASELPTVPATYVEFLAQTEKLKKQVAEAGHIPHEIKVDPIALKTWCDNKTVEVSRKHLREYVVFQLAEKLGKKSEN